MNIKRCSNIVLIACAAGAGFATFFGLRAMMSGGLEAIVVPVVMGALVVPVGLGMLWHFILHFVPRLSSIGLRVAGLAVAGALAITAIMISSWFVTTAIGGRDAVRIDNAEQVDSYRGVLDIAVGNVLAEQRIVPDLSRIATEMTALADGEEHRGQLSGRPGKGPVVDVLRRGAATYGAVVEEASAARDRLNNLRGAATNQLKAMDQVVNGAENLADGQRRFAAAVGDFRQTITEIDALTVLPSMRRLGMFDVPISNAGAGQVQAITSIQAAFARQSEQLTRKVDAIAAQRKELPHISNRPIKPGAAVVEHADKVMAAWCVGVGVDLLPLLLLAMLVIGSLEETAREQAARGQAAPAQAEGTTPPPQRPAAEPSEGRRPQLVAGE